MKTTIERFKIVMGEDHGTIKGALRALIRALKGDKRVASQKTARRWADRLFSCYDHDGPFSYDSETLFLFQEVEALMLGSAWK